LQQTVRRMQLAPGAHLTEIMDSRSKVSRINLYFILPLSRETLTENALLAFIMRKSCAAYPDPVSFSERLYELYGADFDTDVRKMGDSQILCFSIDFLSEKFSPEKDLCRMAADFLMEAVFRPRLIGGAFDEKETVLERSGLADIIRSEINYKRSYAVNQMMRTMFAGKPASMSRLGYEEDLAQIDGKRLAEAFYRVLRTAELEVMMLGSSDFSAAIELLQNELAKIEREPLCHHSCAPIKVGKRRSKEGKMRVSQAKLVMGFGTDIRSGDELLPAMRLVSAMWGGLPTSRLFTVVREKMSLCYHCSCAYDPIRGLLVVDSGIDPANREKAEREILHQLSLLAQGDFTDEEMEEAKLSLLQSYRGIRDSLGSIGQWYFSRIFSNTVVTPEEDAALLHSVTREQFMQAAASLKLDTVYFLGPDPDRPVTEEEGEEEDE